MRTMVFAPVLAAAALVAGSASAAFVDFRSAAFHAANGQRSFDIGVDGVTFHFQAAPWGARLYHDGTDGFGVTSWVGPEADEIEGWEVLSLSFYSGGAPTSLRLDSVLLTDLFNEATRETARIRLLGPDGISLISADAALDQVPGSTNGELWVQLGGALAHEIRFSSPGIVYRNWEEFSVAGIMTGASPMPEPDAALAFGAGSLLVAAALRRRREEPDPS